MQVSLEGRRISLRKSDQIGAGGEGTVFRYKDGKSTQAIKIYHKPPTPSQVAKLAKFVSTSFRIPMGKIAFPLQMVYDSGGSNLVGFSMPLFDRGFEELVSLSNKNYRAVHLVNNREVSSVFLDGGQTISSIHQANLVIGDLNDLNALFSGKEMLFIDVDAWQFGQYVCPVAMEQFVDPRLYGIDFSRKPVFSVESDWYSYAVLLFKSLLRVHPYGGTYKGMRDLKKRAHNRITVFSPDVTVPSIAYSPDMLNDDLAHILDGIFSKGQRGVFPLDVLRKYQDELVVCKKCGEAFPISRGTCPVCNEKMMVVVTVPITVTKGVSSTVFIQTSGRIVFSKLVGNCLYVISYESGKAVLYSRRGNSNVVRKELFDEIPGARYEILNDVLVVNLAKSTELLLLDVSGTKALPLLKSETSLYSGNRRAVFRTSDISLYRTVGGSLLFGQMVNGHLIERIVRQVMDGQTWFSVRTQEELNKPTAFGFFQAMGEQIYWLTWEGMSYDNVSLGKLDMAESLVDLGVSFSSQGVLVRRLTQHQGVSYIRTDVVDSEGRVTYSSGRTREEDHVAPFLHGQVYSRGKLLSASDKGVAQEEVNNGQVKFFDGTKGLVTEGDKLFVYGDGLLVVKEQSAIQITIS